MFIEHRMRFIVLSNIECGHRTSNADIEHRMRFIEYRMRTSNIEYVLSNIECGNRTSNAFYRISNAEIECRITKNRTPNAKIEHGNWNIQSMK